jgi:hypothetical protein
MFASSGTRRHWGRSAALQDGYHFPRQVKDYVDLSSIKM